LNEDGEHVEEEQHGEEFSAHDMLGGGYAMGERRNESIRDQSLRESAVDTRNNNKIWCGGLRGLTNTYLAKNPVEENGLRTSRMPIVIEQVLKMGRRVEQEEDGPGMGARQPGAGF
jgi:hypothetical protein